MKPIDLRTESFAVIRERLNAGRERVHRAWLAHGPGTTREVAAKATIDLLTLRPRSTELYQLGLLKVLDKADGEWIYAARTLEEWEQFCAAQRHAAQSQLQFGLTG